MEEYFNDIEKYNFWNGKVPQLGYFRAEYTNKIIEYTGNKLVKVLTGQRRAGKSYILRQIADKLISSGVNPVNIFYINKEFTDLDFVRTYMDLSQLIKLYKKKLKPKGKVWLFIDEIQNIEEWERFVNSYSQDFADKYEIFISGSNSQMLSGELATHLSGRFIKFEILPFSYTEYLNVTGQKTGKESFISYMEGGALPELFVLPNYDTKRNYTAAIKDTVLLRDIIQRHHIKDPKLLEDVFVYLVNNASKILSINNIVNYLKSHGRKTTYDTIANYIGFIEATFLVHHIVKFEIKGKEIIGGNHKYYINDLCFNNYLYSGFGYGIGYKLENLIYLELRRKGYEIYYGSLKNKEVDFVCKKADRLIYIQSAYLLADTETTKREYASLEMINDSYEKYVVTLDDVILPSNNGIRHIQAWKLGEVL